MKNPLLLFLFFFLYPFSIPLSAQSDPDWMHKLNRLIIRKMGIKFKQSKSFRGTAMSKCFDSIPKFKWTLSCVDCHLYSTDGHCWVMLRIVSDFTKQDSIEWQMEGMFRYKDEITEIPKEEDDMITVDFGKNSKGLGAAINQGLEIARYDYIAYLPADDYFEDTHLANFKEVFDRSENIVLAFSGIQYDKTNASSRIEHPKQ